MCGIGKRYEEIIDHIVSGCPELAKTENIRRHNKAAAYVDTLENMSALQHPSIGQVV